ncbi:hypothetical protein G6F57_003443 [Rhizopus arrhizus]|uniref:Uncharacterized protein n=1 Tax=Rhizopus oryzae TaxID=64495 RepID=A0A9P6XEG8_RHIOR|nr:hypothetical protein G6F23_001291 [Rhizopus arrhizus]KAG1426259.1 hypothetical protein G6F58_001569 [Rhizopus delemar]KAG0769217.1 hypothetical protein G6F24_001271 [Rhizopus arrhizus]KAG0797440.1 hypothetical protein G6F21_000538 [Rhizopus arrhizus]KAG0801276.1 hypothetical protein G6F22_001403 [Rhizopus arrhizus]
MSNNSSEPYDLLDFNNQATRTGFQERLLNAHNASRDQQIENNIFSDLSEENDEEELKKKVLVLQQQVDRMENHVVGLEERLRERRERRQKEAGLTNMTPEERARFVEEEEERDDTEIPDLDVIFEYMLLVGSSATSNTNDLSQADFLKPDTELRKEAMLDQEVLQQTEYSFIKFTEAKNILETQMDSLEDIRHCELSGTSFNEKFTVAFDVLEPSMIMCNLNFEVGIQLKIILGPLLQQIKESCHILGFFQVLVHYARICDQRKTVFEKLAQIYKNSSISANSLSDSRLQFQGSREDSIGLILNWKIVLDNTGRLEANVRDHVKTQLSLDVIAPLAWREKDQSNVLDKVNESFTDLLKIQGVLKATETIVNKILA